MSLALSKVKRLSSRKILAVLALLVLLICISILFVAMHVAGRRSGGENLQINGRKFSLEVATTVQAQELGLGNRASLPANHGMLFAFSGPPVVECFWMKDMHFPIDIIWLDAGKKVVHIEPNVSPATYPKTFCPNEPAEYVIELPAGAAQSAGIRDGETLTF